VRHPLRDVAEAEVDEPGALHVLGACSAFVTYLVCKGQDAGGITDEKREALRACESEGLPLAQSQLAYLRTLTLLASGSVIVERLLERAGAVASAVRLPGRGMRRKW